MWGQARLRSAFQRLQFAVSGGTLPMPERRTVEALLVMPCDAAGGPDRREWELTTEGRAQAGRVAEQIAQLTGDRPVLVVRQPAHHWDYWETASVIADALTKAGRRAVVVPADTDIPPSAYHLSRLADTGMAIVMVVNPVNVEAELQMHLIAGASADIVEDYSLSPAAIWRLTATFNRHVQGWKKRLVDRTYRFVCQP